MKTARMILGSVVVSAGLLSAAEPLPAEVYARAEQQGLRPGWRIYRDRVSPHWMDGDRFWYANTLPGGRKEFVVVDASSGVRRVVAEPPREASGEEQREEPPRRDRPRRERGRAEVREGALIVRSGDGEKRVTLPPPPDRALYRDATASPDGAHAVVWLTIASPELPMPVVESAPRDTLRPQARSYNYAMPGDPLDVHRPYVVDLAAGRIVAAETDPIDEGGPPRVTWRPDGRRCLYVQAHRGHRRVRVVELDCANGRARTVIDDTSKTFIPPMKTWSHFLSGGSEILWMSERDGWNHLYRFDGESGALLNRITRGEWAVLGVESVDDGQRKVLFRAGGREPDQDPYFVHYYRVGFDGEDLVRLTEGNGTHRIRFAPGGRYLLDTWSRVDQPPVTELHRATDGSLVRELERADISELVKAGWRPPEAFAAPGRDGRTMIHGVAYFPSDFSPTGRYPVVEHIYAGPQDAFVPKSFHAGNGMRSLAELGFVVVQIDGMGTSGRSKTFHDVAWHNLADSGFADRIAWIRALAKRHPAVDLAPGVGIYGSSAGGYNAARALIDHPEFYSTAVALAGNHDHRTDKQWWPEVWMGWPIGPHYREQSNTECAGRLRGRLLLIHGELDDNVNPHAATMQFAKALMDAGKDFDLLIVPGTNHGLNHPYVQGRQWDHFVRHLRGREPPRDYRMKGGSGDDVTIAVRNRTSRPVALFWVNFTGGLTKYADLAPGAERAQHTYEGHQWVAMAGEVRISEYTAGRSDPVWEVE